MKNIKPKNYFLKNLLLVILSLFFALGVYTQNRGIAPLAKGEKQLNFGTGFSSNGMPVYVSMDFALHKDVTLTPEVHIEFDDPLKGGILVKADYQWNYLIGIPNNWDFYAGRRISKDVIIINRILV